MPDWKLFSKIVQSHNYDILELDPTVKRNGFRDFLVQRNLSESFAAKYMTYLTSSLVRAKTKQVSGQDNIYRFLS